MTMSLAWLCTWTNPEVLAPQLVVGNTMARFRRFRAHAFAAKPISLVRLVFGCSMSVMNKCGLGRLMLLRWCWHHISLETDSEMR